MYISTKNLVKDFINSLFLFFFYSFKLATIKELNNVTTKGVKVKVKVKKWAPSGSKIRVKIDVGKKKSIRNLIVWAETVNGEHIGYWNPISAHVYVSGCDGPANSTISNQIDLNRKFYYVIIILKKNANI